MSPQAHRPYSKHLLGPPINPTKGRDICFEAASTSFMLETLGTHAEIASIGRDRFSGNIAYRNSMWREFRNYLRQALSNYAAALSVPNRSAALLYYYAMLNFAKAELLDTHATQLVNKRIGHGLSFSPTQAKTVSGDKLKVVDGVFPLLYERRTGRSLRPKTNIPISRLLGQVPEIAAQTVSVSAGHPQTAGSLHATMANATHAWTVLVFLEGDPFRNSSSTSAKLFNKYFVQIEPPPGWRGDFGVSGRYFGMAVMYESRKQILIGPSMPVTAVSNYIMTDIEQIVSMSTSEDYDIVLSPSLYESRMLSMPISLARYALTYYASSLVRYKPQMFDGQTFPEQAYLFDAIARELSLPILQDVLASIKGKETLFISSGGLRT